jgi:hypothetical protein
MTQEEIDAAVEVAVDAAVERAYSRITDVVVREASGDAITGMPRAVGTATALIQVAAIFAGVICRLHSFDIEKFAQMARVEFELAIERARMDKVTRH